MIEDVGLNPFVILPHHGIGKEIELHRKPRLRGLHLPHHQRHAPVHRNLLPQVADQIGAENAQIGLVQAVDPPLARADAVRGVVGFDAPLRFVDILPDEVDLPVTRQHLRRAEPDARHVDRHRTHHAAAARELHPAPVLERIGGEQVGRQHDDRIVPVADLHGRKRHLLHRAVRPVLRHGDPVADLQHVVGRELDARHESQDAVAEDQHDDGRRSAQPGQQDRRGLADQDGHDENRTDQQRDALRRLPQSLDGLVLPGGARCGDTEGGIEQRVDEAEDRNDDIGLHEAHHDDAHAGTLLEHDREHDGQQHGAQNVTGAAQHPDAEQRVVPHGARTRHEPPHAADDDQPAGEIEQYDEEQHQQKGDPAIPPSGVRRDPQPPEQQVGPMLE